jgi:hypothetical protein
MPVTDTTNPLEALLPPAYRIFYNFLKWGGFFEGGGMKAGPPPTPEQEIQMALRTLQQSAGGEDTEGQGESYLEVARKAYEIGDQSIIDQVLNYAADPVMRGMAVDEGARFSETVPSDRVTLSEDEIASMSDEVGEAQRGGATNEAIAEIYQKYGVVVDPASLYSGSDKDGIISQRWKVGTDTDADASSDTTTTANADGTVTTTHADGSTTTANADGTVTTTTTNADGTPTTTTTNADGTPTNSGGEGGVIDTWIYDEAQNVFINKKNGQVIQNNPNIMPSEMAVLTDGAEYTVFNNGVDGQAEDLIKNAEGDVVGEVGTNRDADGNVIYGVVLPGTNTGDANDSDWVYTGDTDTGNTDSPAWNDSVNNGKFIPGGTTTTTGGTAATEGTAAILGTAGTAAILGTAGTAAIPGTAGTEGTAGYWEEIPGETSTIPGTAGTAAILGTAGTAAIPGTAGTEGTAGYWEEIPGETSTIPGTAGTAAIPGTAGTAAIPGTEGTPGTAGYWEEIPGATTIIPGTNIPYTPSYRPITPILPGGWDRLGYEDILVGGGEAYESPYSILPAPASDPRLAGRRPQDIRNVGAAVGLRSDRPYDQQDPRAVQRMARYVNQFGIGTPELADIFGTSVDDLSAAGDYYGVDFDVTGPTGGTYSASGNSVSGGVIGGGVNAVAPGGYGDDTTVTGDPTRIWHDAVAGTPGTEAVAAVAGTDYVAATEGTDDTTVTGDPTRIWHDAVAGTPGTEAVAAVAGTDYVAATEGTDDTTVTGDPTWIWHDAVAGTPGTEAVAAVAGTDYVPAVAGTDYVAATEGTAAIPGVTTTTYLDELTNTQVENPFAPVAADGNYLPADVQYLKSLVDNNTVSAQDIADYYGLGLRETNQYLGLAQYNVDNEYDPLEINTVYNSLNSGDLDMEVASNYFQQSPEYIQSQMDTIAANQSTGALDFNDGGADGALGFNDGGEVDAMEYWSGGPLMDQQLEPTPPPQPSQNRQEAVMRRIQRRAQSV